MQFGSPPPSSRPLPPLAHSPPSSLHSSPSITHRSHPKVHRWAPHQRYSGVPHTRFLFWGERSLWILGFRVHSRPNPSSGALKSTLPGPREGSSILNVDLVVVSAAVANKDLWFTPNLFASRSCGREGRRLPAPPQACSYTPCASSSSAGAPAKGSVQSVVVSSSQLSDVWMCLQLMRLQFGVVRGPVGVVWVRFGTGLGLCGPQVGPTSAPHDPDRASDKCKLQPHELEPHPQIANNVVRDLSSTSRFFPRLTRCVLHNTTCCVYGLHW